MGLQNRHREGRVRVLKLGERGGRGGGGGVMLI